MLIIDLDFVEIRDLYHFSIELSLRSCNGCRMSEGYPQLRSATYFVSRSRPVLKDTCMQLDVGRKEDDSSIKSKPSCIRASCAAIAPPGCM